MLEKMNLVCSEILTLAMQLNSAHDLPSLEVLQHRLASLFEGMEDRARAAGMPNEDVLDVKYALCAFIDEQLLQSQWPGRAEWMARPLQLVYFNETTAGEGFFNRAESLMRQPQKAHVLQIYYLCISLGFRGKYAVAGESGLARLGDEMRRMLEQHSPPAEPLSPHGAPVRSLRRLAQGKLPIVAVSAGILVSALLIVLFMRFWVSSSASQVTEKLQGRAAVPADPVRV